MIQRSRFKHVFGKGLKKDQCYDCIKITKSSADSSFCSVNPLYVAIITEAAGGGAFLVIPIDKTGRQDADSPVVGGHTAAVLDVQWSPHDDDIIASGSEDCTAKVWQIPAGGLNKKNGNLNTPIVDLVAHQRRVSQVLWHPCASDVLLTAGADNLVIVWNTSFEEIIKKIEFPEIIYCMSFNYNGSKLVTTCKDKNTRVINPRTGDILQEGKCHEGQRPQQCVFLKGDMILTTGFSRMGDRQYALWDETLPSSPQCLEELDTSNGVMFPFYDYDTQLIFMVGKGDSVIRYFDYSPDEKVIRYLNRFDTSDSQRGCAWMCKRGLNMSNNEIARCFKLHNKNLCEVISFTVPRKSDLFQEDLYPDTAGSIPAMTAGEWVEGKDADPLLISMKDIYYGAEKKTGPDGGQLQKKPRTVQRKVNPVGQSGDKSNGTSETSLSEIIAKEMKTELAKVTDQVVLLNNLVKSLSDRITKLESANSGSD